MTTHDAIMQQLIDYAYERMAKRNAYPFCAFVVKNGVIVGKGYNDTQNSWGDRTTHGEMVAMTKVARAQQNSDATQNCILYTTCEPCLACFETAYWAGISTIVYAVGKDDYHEYFNDHLFDIHAFAKQSHSITTIPHILHDEGVKLFQTAKEKYGW